MAKGWIYAVGRRRVKGVMGLGHSSRKACGVESEDGDGRGGKPQAEGRFSHKLLSQY